MAIPPEYHGREQTYLKHQVLKQYLNSWAQKFASISRTRPISLWYVDCFAGPWRTAGTDYQDTSVWIGLQALNAAERTWKDNNFQITFHAVFIEKDTAAFNDLKTLIKKEKGAVEVHPLEGEFGDHVATINQMVENDPTFLFVDPTGWKGASMEYIAPLSMKPGRDIMINVMSDYINRFHGASLEFIRLQMQDFFGCTVARNLKENELLTLYRKQLKTKCKVRYAADLIIPHPSKNRVKFRLVIGGHNKAVLKLFRDAEKKVIGKEAGQVYSETKQRLTQTRTGQLPLDFEPTIVKTKYFDLNKKGIFEARASIPRILKADKLEFDELWPVVLEECHITLTDLKKLLWEMYGERIIGIDGLKPRERSVKSGHILYLLKN